MTQGYGTAQAGRSVDNNPLTLNGGVYPHGIGTHAPGEFSVNLHGAATHFDAMVGVDDEKKTSPASVTFMVLVDGKPAAKTGILHGGDKAQLLSVDLTGAQKLTLEVGDGGDGMDSDHVDWCASETCGCIKDVGTFTNGYSVEVPAHGCVLLKIGKPSGHD